MNVNLHVLPPSSTLSSLSPTPSHPPSTSSSCTSTSNPIPMISSLPVLLSGIAILILPPLPYYLLVLHCIPLLPDPRLSSLSFSFLPPPYPTCRYLPVLSILLFLQNLIFVIRNCIDWILNIAERQKVPEMSMMLPGISMKDRPHSLVCDVQNQIPTSESRLFEVLDREADIIDISITSYHRYLSD